MVLCYIVIEDNEVVIKMIIKGRSPTMRHVSRTNKVALDWFERINLDPQNPNQVYPHQTPTRRHFDKGNFTRDEWNNLLYLCNISNFSLLCCSQSFRDKIAAKSKPMMMMTLGGPVCPVRNKTDNSCVAAPKRAVDLETVA